VQARQTPSHPEIDEVAPERQHDESAMLQIPRPVADVTPDENEQAGDDNFEIGRRQDAYVSPLFERLD
jgi:hypothetical protein